MSDFEYFAIAANIYVARIVPFHAAVFLFALNILGAIISGARQ